MGYDEVKCGTFMDWSFGGLLRRARIKNELTLRAMCIAIKMDAGNYSKLEHSRLAPPQTKKAIDKILKPLKIDSAMREMIYVAAYNHHLGELKGRFG